MSNLDFGASELLRLIERENVEQFPTDRDAWWQCFEVNLVGVRIEAVRRIVWDQLHPEWPLRVDFFVSELVVVRKTLDTHVAWELANLRKFGM